MRSVVLLHYKYHLEVSLVCLSLDFEEAFFLPCPDELLSSQSIQGRFICEQILFEIYCKRQNSDEIKSKNHHKNDDFSTYKNVEYKSMTFHLSFRLFASLSFSELHCILKWKIAFHCFLLLCLKVNEWCLVIFWTSFTWRVHTELQEGFGFFHCFLSISSGKQN